MGGLSLADEPQENSVIHAACKVCNAEVELFGQDRILNKYDVSYLRCVACGFIQTEDPYWLNEAYSAAIASQDVGIMSRNLITCEITAAVINLLFPDLKNAVDYGGGHGVLVRLMRDRGFNFFWSDLHASNDFARGFEAPRDFHFDFLTAFEVLEHLVDPISEIAKLLELSDNVLVSTCLVPTPAPRLDQWWYYMQASGQHISFYTKQSLDHLAVHFGRYLLSSGTFHLFTKEPTGHFRYRLATSPRTARLINRAFRRPSLIPNDLATLTR